jgi:hypothetical protein
VQNFPVVRQDEGRHQSIVVRSKKLEQHAVVGSGFGQARRRRNGDGSRAGAEGLGIRRLAVEWVEREKQNRGEEDAGAWPVQERVRVHCFSELKLRNRWCSAMVSQGGGSGGRRRGSCEGFEPCGGATDL